MLRIVSCFPHDFDSLTILKIRSPHIDVNCQQLKPQGTFLQFLFSIDPIKHYSLFFKSKYSLPSLLIRAHPM